ncbi:HEPN domain-containing protein [Actinorhabdospora filicis]|uniref:HEPN domain-containing protein n=1 Tax=Actinorhabdospora filicis TaxID=1785913 RepID=UPI0025556AEA|nr:HEPN domain-containing protein [Actinorhabdospora filicis]
MDELADAIGQRPSKRPLGEQVWLTRFFVVRICGYLEQVVYEVTREHVRQKSGGRIQDFSLTWLEKTRNPSKANLLDLVRRFGVDLWEDLSRLLDSNDEELSRELAFLVDRRNKIAHGLNEGVTESKALALKGAAERVAAWFIDALKPN